MELCREGLLAPWGYCGTGVSDVIGAYRIWCGSDKGLWFNLVWLVEVVSLVFVDSLNAIGDGSLSVAPKYGRLRLGFKSLFRRKRLLKSSSWPSTSYLDNLPLFVVPQRMLLKQREYNSNFLPARSSLCFGGIFINILNSYALYLLILITTICRFANARKPDHLYVNEFIMPSVLQIYFWWRINRSTLSHGKSNQIIH